MKLHRGCVHAEPLGNMTPCEKCRPAWVAPLLQAHAAAEYRRGVEQCLEICHSWTGSGSGGVAHAIGMEIRALAEKEAKP